jgi:hypothetical protein
MHHGLCQRGPFDGWKRRAAGAYVPSHKQEDVLDVMQLRLHENPHAMKVPRRVFPAEVKLSLVAANLPLAGAW